MNKKSVSRVDHEADEQLKEIKNDVPENRIQQTQQIADTNSALDTKGADSSFTAKKSKIKGATLKQEAIADMISGSANTSGMGISASGRGVSGTNGGILGANNSTPVADKSRSDSRVGKKLDRIATKLNFTPSEQVIVAVDESKPLADASDADQGYNGTYRNETARAQKIAGAVPGDLMFQRSVDLITKDNIYYVEGQQVFQVAGDKTGLNPTKSCFGEEDMSEYHDVTYHSGNFLHRALHFGLDDKGKTKYFYADVEDLTYDGTVDPEIANVSSAHRLIKSNVAEIDRQVMDAKAGDEKAEIWSDLPRAIPQPTQAAYLMSSIEADTGAFVYTAYAKAGTNMAYQLNRGPKDGLDEITPAIEECVGWRSSDTDNSTIGSTYSNSLSNVFNVTNYKKGDPTLMIAAYDSLNKYKNKADLLLQPRGFRMHLQTADNNINPIKVPKEFAAVFNGQETFSTIDHEYDALLPICMTDKTSLITVHNFNELAGFIKYDTTLKVKWSATNIAENYDYTSLTLVPKTVRSKLGYTDSIYVLYKKSSGDGLVYDSSSCTITWDPDSANLTNATVDVILSKENSAEGYTLLATYAYNAAKDLTIHIPKVQAASSGHTSVVTAVEFSTSDEVTEYYYGAGPYAYSFSNLRNNYAVEVKHPLIEGMIQYLDKSIGGKMREILGKDSEIFIPLVFSTQYMTLAQLFICAATPWIVRARDVSMLDVIDYENEIHEYPYSKLDSIKNVPFHNYINFNFAGYDSPLETKIMDPVVAIRWIMPEFFWKVGSSKYVLPWYFNQNECTVVSSGKIDLDASAMSFPSIRSGIRLGVLDTLYGMTEKDVRLSLDRMTKAFLSKSTISKIAVYKYGRNTDGQPYIELSDSDVISMFDYLACPRELGLSMDAPYGLYAFNSSNVATALTSEVAPSFEIKIWTNPSTPVTPSILSASNVNINRGKNYVQKWLKLASSTADSDTVLTGLVFGMNDEGAAEFKPFGALTGQGSQDTDCPTIISLQRSLWTRIQLLPFVISPFDGHATDGSGVRDIYDIAYMFGLCGFRASDYRESVYNREKEAVNQGLLFINDPWIIDSPIIKAGSHSIGVSNTRGYEIKRV